MAETAFPAFVCAVHVAFAMLRRHRASGRSVFSIFVLPSFVFALTPWLWPAPPGLWLTLVAHVTWLGLCEVLAPPASRQRPARSIRSATQAPARPTAATNRFVPMNVLAVLEECHDIKTFRVERPEGWDFVPGQFVAIRVQIDGKPLVRCYSVSSAPASRGYLEISVRRQGLVSGVLHATIRPGSTLAVNRPTGQFVYPGGDDRPLVLLAGGIGITPLLSILRHATAVEPSRQVTLLYSARTASDVAFQDELTLIAQRHPQVRIAITLTRPDDDTPYLRGRLDGALLRQWVPAPEHALFYLCGPGQMIADLCQVLAAMGVPERQVRYERFEAAVAAAHLQAPTETALTPSSSGSLRVTFGTSGVSVSASPARTLLEIAEEGGVAIPSSCRAGVCQTCRTKVTAGNVDCRSAVMDPDDEAAGYVLPCVTWPVGDCALDA